MPDAPQQRELVLFEAHPRAAPETQAPPGQLSLNRFHGNGKARREALDYHDQSLAVGFTGGEEAQHAPDRTQAPARAPRQPAPSAQWCSLLIQAAGLPIAVDVALEGLRSRSKGRIAARLSGSALVLAGTEMVLLGASAGVVGAVPQTPLKVTQQLTQAVSGLPFALTLVVTAPSDRPARGIVVGETLPACVTLAPGATLPAGVTATARPASPQGSAACGAPSSVVLTGLGDLAAGASEQVTLQLLSTQAIGTVLPFAAHAAASSTSHPARLDQPAAALWGEVADAPAATATVTGFGVAETDSGLPSPASPGAPDGTVTDTVTVTGAPGWTARQVAVDVYLSAGLAVAGCATTTAPGAPACLTPQVDIATLPIDPARPGLPATPQPDGAAPPAPAAASPSPTTAAAALPTAAFNHLHWVLPTLSGNQPVAFSYMIDAPLQPAAQPADLIVVSATTTQDPVPSTPDAALAGAADSSPPAPQAVASQVAAVHEFTWSQPLPLTAPATPVTTPPATAPPTVVTPRTVSAPPPRPVLGSRPGSPRRVAAAIIAGQVAPGTGAPGGVADGIPAAAAPQVSTTAVRNPFTTPGATTVPAPAPTSVAAASTPTTTAPAVSPSGGSSSLSTTLAHTGVDARVQVLVGADLILMGSGLAVFGGRRPKRREVAAPA